MVQFQRHLATSFEKSYASVGNFGPSHSPGVEQGKSSTSSLDNNASSTSSSAATADGGGYVSPLQDLFDRMHANGPTTLGTTDEYVEFEKELERRSKKLECGIPQTALRFYSSSWGRTLNAPHVMNKEHQVTVKINTAYLPLTKQEREILREIVGNRLNDERHELRLSSNQFGSRIENKRHVVSMLDRIILSCQRMGKTLDDDDDSHNITNNDGSSNKVDEGSSADAQNDTPPKEELSAKA